MKRWISVLLFLLFTPFMFMFNFGCKGTPTTPQPPGPVEPTEDIVELLYVRSMEVINENGTGGGGFNAYNYTLGGFSTDQGQLLSIESWMAEIKLKFDVDPYWINTIDSWVTPEGQHMSVAYRIFARIKGDTEWIELTHLEKNPRTSGGGYWARMFLNKQGITP